MNHEIESLKRDVSHIKNVELHRFANAEDFNLLKRDVFNLEKQVENFQSEIWRLEELIDRLEHKLSKI